MLAAGNLPLTEVDGSKRDEAPAVSLQRTDHSQIEPTQNKSRIRVLTLEPQKATANGPSLPRIPPQLHHQNTTFCNRLFPKTPVKTLQNTRLKKTGSKSGKSYSASIFFSQGDIG
jgi:hypothetical protein